MSAIPAPIPALLRTAIDLKQALDNADAYLTPIGTCRSKASEWRRNHNEDTEDEEDGSLGEEVEIQVMEELHKLQTGYGKTVASGLLMDLPFRLIITRAGCEFDVEVNPRAEGDDAQLRRWYDAGAVSGYGDVKAQETKVDPAVRDAREIPASEFTVPPELIARVQDLWCASDFFPTHVRAEPYKIHLCGPGGKFTAHRDTPETDLVGTFLLGLGETCKTTEGGWTATQGAFEIKSSGARRPTRHAAHPGYWVAFYPDVDHSMREIASRYRAVVAFKIFRQHLDPPEVPADVALRRKITDVLRKLQKPYGILLQHHYSAGTAELNGVDTALYAAAGETGNGDVKLLPVLIRWTALKDYSDYTTEDGKCSAEVFPMTETHVDTVLAHIRTKTLTQEKEEVVEEANKLFVDLKGTDSEWIGYHSTESIPFYSPAFDETSIAWKEDVQDAIDHTGNSLSTSRGPIPSGLAITAPSPFRSTAPHSTRRRSRGRRMSRMRLITPGMNRGRTRRIVSI
ncbi:hypothetical protein DFH07DRAFT_929384 [Mycena maculata]|uniref:Prolyl 4-hydroxylase alpha subunit Fe(2+) 2OG dioxygenase domain-containing protein n=1 Tax=Mycena maculata TaxID=230809 RepID=A0AAD7HY86_9AGAR|nr:hypothetical protein DFH07DRAFT_929384 [Mycena maculata]